MSTGSSAVQLQEEADPDISGSAQRLGLPGREAQEWQQVSCLPWMRSLASQRQGVPTGAAGYAEGQGAWEGALRSRDIHCH